MARTARYVSSSGSATYAASTSSSTPMSWATMLANAAAGDDCYVKKDGTYSRTTNFDAFTNAGTNINPIRIIGYNSATTDGYLGRTNGSGALITTNMPVITYTNAYLTPDKAYVILENLNLSCSFSGQPALQLRTQANQYAINCVVTNSAASNSSNAAATVNTAPINVINCDLTCTGGDGIKDSSSGGYYRGNRISASGGNGINITTSGGHVVLFNTFLPCAIGVKLGSASATSTIIDSNTFYSCSTAGVQTANATATNVLRVINNMMTDSGYAVQSLYQPTADNPCVRMFNRTRDNTNADTGFTDWPIYGAITTDTGNYTTDYVDATTNDLRLISASPAKGAGLPSYMDCGAQQRQEVAGGRVQSLTRGLVS